MAKPEIRLKGFEGEWEKFELNQIFQERHVISTITPDLPQLSFTIEEGIIKPENRKSNKRDFLIKDKTNKKYLVTLLNDIIYNPANVIHGAIHKNSLCNGVVSPIYKIFYTDQNADFIDCVVRRKSFIREISKYMEGTVLKLRTLKPESFLNISIYIGSTIEQNIIASFFQHLDSQIQSTTKKIESLKQVKIASLQSMFPQAGETAPRVRFKGFEGEWDKKELSSLYEPSSIKNKIYGADKIISVANMYFKPVSYISDDEYLKSYNVMSLGDIAFEGNKSKYFANGRFVENTIGDGIVSHVFVVLKPISKKYDLQFWKYYINYERIMGPILQRCTKHSTMMTDIVVTDFLKESILVPSYEEQKKIGTFFEILDKQISLQEKRLEKLKQIKAACLDKMFV